MNVYSAAQEIQKDLYLLRNYVGAWEIKMCVSLLLPGPPTSRPPDLVPNERAAGAQENRV